MLDEHNNDAVMVKMNEEEVSLAKFVKKKKEDHERDKSVFMANN